MTGQEVLDRITALRRITLETGCITRRAQSELLASVPNGLLIQIAPQLNKIFNETATSTERNRNEHERNYNR